MRLLTTSAALATAAALAMLAVAPARALDEPKDEKDRLRACEQKLCAIVAKKSTNDLACTLAKTWHKDKLKEGSASGKISWGFGDAHCSVDLQLPHAAITEALTKPESTLQFAEHTVTCKIEREKEVSTITARLSPKVIFKDGKAHKIWVNLKDVEGPAVVRGLAATAAKLEDGIGIFHKPLIKALNWQLSEKCAKVASGG